MVADYVGSGKPKKRADAIAALNDIIGQANAAGYSVTNLKPGGTRKNDVWQVSARAAGGDAQGWTLVGEQGPELVNFPVAAHVTSAPRTSAALGGMEDLLRELIDLEKNASGAGLKMDQAGYRQLADLLALAVQYLGAMASRDSLAAARPVDRKRAA